MSQNLSFSINARSSCVRSLSPPSSSLSLSSSLSSAADSAGAVGDAPGTVALAKASGGLRRTSASREHSVLSAVHAVHVEHGGGLYDGDLRLEDVLQASTRDVSAAAVGAGSASDE